jgi:hypothetical protein
MVTFKKWLLESAKISRNPTGDLLSDLIADDELPNVTSSEELRRYLVSCCACGEAVRQASIVWRQYQRWLSNGGKS